MQPKISIVTITFNSENTVEETIKSVISQDYSNLEYIIIDGASTDRTLEVVNKYRDRIARIVSEPDKGISDAFNKGIRYATGDVIGIINSDDILLPGALQAVAAAYEEGVGVYRGNICTGNHQKLFFELLSFFFAHLIAIDFLNQRLAQFFLHLRRRFLREGNRQN